MPHTTSRPARWTVALAVGLLVTLIGGATDVHAGALGRPLVVTPTPLFVDGGEHPGATPHLEAIELLTPDHLPAKLRRTRFPASCPCLILTRPEPAPSLELPVGSRPAIVTELFDRGRPARAPPSV